jgi:dihydrofolate reductase
MRKIVAQLFIALDGVVEAPEIWHLQYWNDELRAAVASQLEVADILLLGRGTYEVFAASWPQRSSDTLFADRINSMPKLVVSSTLTGLHWRNSTLLRGDVAEELTRLKERPGNHITVSGSPTLVRWLLRTGLLDELQLLVHPVVVGGGARLFPDAGDPQKLALAQATPFETGVLDLTYRPLQPAARADRRNGR